MMGPDERVTAYGGVLTNQRSASTRDGRSVIPSIADRYATLPASLSGLPLDLLEVVGPGVGLAAKSRYGESRTSLVMSSWP